MVGRKVDSIRVRRIKRCRLKRLFDMISRELSWDARAARVHLDSSHATNIHGKADCASKHRQQGLTIWLEDEARQQHRKDVKAVQEDLFSTQGSCWHNYPTDLRSRERMRHSGCQLQQWEKWITTIHLSAFPLPNP